MYSVWSGGRTGFRDRLHAGWLCALVAMVSGLGTAQAFAQYDYQEQQKLTASDSGATGRFGDSVSLDGDTIVVGRPEDQCAAGEHCGSAYVLRFNGTSWVKEQKLTASDADADKFARSVSVSGDTVVLAAQFDDCAAGENCGAAYVFRFNGISWIEAQKLTASDAAESDYFGTTVSVSGDTTVIGASNDDCAAGKNCGSAYVYRFNGTSWIEAQKLTASDAAAFDDLGISVCVSGDTAVLGAPFADCAVGTNCGAVYVFRFDGTSWIEEQKLTADDAGDHDLFGMFVSVSGDTAVLGAILDDCAAGENCGSAYVFRFNGTSWVEEQKLTDDDAKANDQFGRSVSVSGDTAVLGAPFVDCPEGTDCGSVYVFRFDGSNWVQEQKLNVSPVGDGAVFGDSVSVSGDRFVVGADLEGCAASNNCGAAYVFSRLLPEIIPLPPDPIPAA